MDHSGRDSLLAVLKAKGQLTAFLSPRPIFALRSAAFEDGKINLTAARALLATAVLLPVWWIAEGPGTVLKANWAKGAWVGFVTLGLASFLVIIALRYNDPVTVAIVSAVMPVIGILLECLADHRPFTRALALPIEAGATYVFDKGYCDYQWWARIHAQQAWFATCLSPTWSA